MEYQQISDENFNHLRTWSQPVHRIGLLNWGEKRCGSSSNIGSGNEGRVYRHLK